ncbi:hypothetical protein GCM10009681_16830 [Luedemannella helvata]|uniref:Uncharacterized protein n=1 Tax=Luedemannella helvata TaxID=349315 RepID=A0ABN2K1B2_9ACTN
MVAGAATLVVALGCGVINQAKDLVDNVATLGDFADRLGKAQNLTYTAKYDLAGQGEDVAHLTMAQQPPNTVFLGKEGRYLSLADATYVCDVKDGGTTCTRSPSTATAGADGSALAGAAGGTFVSPELALGLVLAASVVPGVTVSKSEKTIAEQDVLCANVTGLEAAADAGTTDGLRDFSVCITDNGVLASFAGTLQNGEAAKVEMTSYSTKADPKLFELPKGARIVDTVATPTG